MALLGRSKPVHLRGCSREDEDAVFAAEDAKRPRAVSPSSALSTAAESAAAVSTAGSRVSEGASSIYKLTSPWLTVPPAPEESHAALAASKEEGGGARALRFEAEGEGQDEVREDQVGQGNGRTAVLLGSAGANTSKKERARAEGRVCSLGALLLSTFRLRLSALSLGRGKRRQAGVVCLRVLQQQQRDRDRETEGLGAVHLMIEESGVLYDGNNFRVWCLSLFFLCRRVV